MLSKDEFKLYDRQILMPELSERGQEKLKNSTVFIAGAGGLGSPVSMYLAAAGIGNIIISDYDTIELSNLNRQILHWPEDVGSKKVESAVRKLRKMNSFIRVEGIFEKITDENITELTRGCDAIVDAMDNIATRFTLNRAAVKWNIPLFHGAVNGMEGRVTTIVPGETACIGCMYPSDISPSRFPVLGVTPGIIGVLQAAEVIKFIAGMGELLKNRLLIYDGMDPGFKEFKLSRNPECRECKNI